MSTLAILSPIDPGTNTRVSMRVTASQDQEYTGAAGEKWWPAISEQPTLRLSLFDGDFTSAVDPASANLTLRIDVLQASGEFPRVERYEWAGASVRLYRLVNGALSELAVMRVESFALENFALALNLSVDSEPFDKDVLFSEYAGTTGVEGGADLKGTIKPWAFGRCRNVEPVFIDQIDNVFQVSGYGPVSAIPMVYERGAEFGASNLVGNFANYAALVAADIPEGKWGTCLAQGLFRLGAPPAGVVTCDVDGDTTSGFLRRTGAIIKEIARRLDLTSMVDAASLDALDAAVARNVNVFIAEQVSLIDLARRMVAPCNAVAGIGLDGKLIAPRVAFGAEQVVLDVQGRQMPPVLGAARQNTRPPYKRVQMGAARSWRVHTFDEIAFFADLIDRGLYSASQVYREGDIVSLIDKSRWVYINPVANSGNAPPTWPVQSNAFWSNTEPPASADVAIANNRVVLQGMESNLPEEVDFIGQVFAAVDTGNVFRYDGPVDGWVLVSTVGAIIPTPGSGETGNIRDHLGEVYDPGELLNTSIELTPDGRLQYRPLPAAPPVVRGQITLPDIGAASAAAMRRAEDDVDALANALATALDEASRTRQTFTDAGFFVDPASGQVRIHAVQQTLEQLNLAEIRLDAAEANINLRATTSYVDQAIANAVLDLSQIADLDTIFVRLTAAEVDIDGLEATVTTLATVTELSLVAGRVSTAEQAIDALEGTITTKVDTTTFDALETRVTSAESTLTAIGDVAQITNAVTATRLLERAADANAEATLAALLQDDRNQRDQVAAVASARQELRADVSDGLAAEAAARLILQAEVDQNAASLATESITRASEDAALASQITALQASTTGSVNTLTAAIQTEQTTRSNADTALAADITDLTASLEAAETALTAAIAAEQQARVDNDGALATSITNLNASFTAAITTEQQARIAAITAEEAARTAAINAEADARIAAIAQEANNRGTAILAEEQARIDAINAERTQTLADVAAEAAARQAAVTSLTASIQQEATARANADSAIAATVTTLTTTVNQNSATLVTFGESIDGLRARQGVRLDVNGRITGYVQNNDGTQGDFTIVADNFRVVDPDTGAAFIDADDSGLRLRNGRVIMDNGLFIKAVGVGFGTSGQFIEWFGPRPTGGNLALCDEASALAYLKTDGSAFFGGSLSAGIIRNAARTTDIGPGATITIGPFGTNGSPIQVITGYSVQSVLSDTYNDRASWDAAVSAWGADPSGGSVNQTKAISCSVVVQVTRALGGGSPAAFATLTIASGTESISGSFIGGFGTLEFVRTVTGSITSTDNSGGTQNRTFTATITNRTNATIGTVQSQTVSLTATEE